MSEGLATETLGGTEPRVTSWPRRHAVGLLAGPLGIFVVLLSIQFGQRHLRSSGTTPVPSVAAPAPKPPTETPKPPTETPKPGPIVPASPPPGPTTAPESAPAGRTPNPGPDGAGAALSKAGVKPIAPKAPESLPETIFLPNGKQIVKDPHHLLVTAPAPAPATQNAAKASAQPTGPPPLPGGGSRREQAELSIQAARLKLQGGDVSAAADLFSRALQLDPRSAEARAGLGEVAFEQGSWDDAASHLRQAIKLAPRHASYHVLLGQSLYKLGRFKEAVTACRNALKLNPSMRDAQQTLDMAEKKLSEQD